MYWEFEETDQVALRKEDPKEDTDLSGQHPELVEQMVEIIRSQHTESPHFKVTIP